ncbi:ankyrin repeat domain-containing protein [Roseofilum capinflatum]|uniref:Ankyrin repeat domain-containing protein n=1 Tax=Roseofilum capinflatum BLCC-M114 TaxID=3022440 RepID=A0ABT7B1P4_9CYAN|nr:ankyrin repeat domain-containing protein [Roseofilum capinflatum]MDJ1173086.1 ankyrin repeat domain-containing protein [Roseofilum capinflatum BLCC-M114]
MILNIDRQLIEAVKHENLSLVQELLDAGANPNVKDGNQHLLEICEYKREIRYELVKAGAWKNNLKTELVMAIPYGIEVVRTLVEKGADVNVQTFSGTPLSVAAGRGEPEIVSLLIQSGADLDAKAPLLNALKGKHFEIALELLREGADPNITDTFDKTPAIALATAAGNDPKANQVLKALLAAGVNVNQGISGITINDAEVKKQAGEALGTLFKSLEAVGEVWEKIETLEETDDPEAEAKQALEELEAIKSQSSASPSVQPIHIRDTVPLILAARCGYAQTVAILLEAGAHPHEKDGEGLSAFDWATRNQDTQVLDVLRSFGIVDTPISQDEILLKAAVAGAVDAARSAIEQGANVDTRDRRRDTRNKTPLMLAAREGHVDMVNLLLSAGAHPNLDDLAGGEVPFLLSGSYSADSLNQYGYQAGRTALMLAVEAGHRDVVEALLAAKPDLNQQDGLNVTALMIACEKGHLDIVQQLLAEGADINLNIKGVSALSIAVWEKQEEIAMFLINQGADFQVQSEDRENLLMRAASMGSLPLVQLLLSKGMDVNARSGDSTALIDALNYYNSEEENLEVIETLLAAGADPNLGNYEGGTALTAGVYRGSVDAIRALLAAGVDIEQRDREGRTALSLAKVFGRSNVLNLLREWAGDRAQELEIDLEQPDDEYEEDPRADIEYDYPDFSERGRDPAYGEAVQELAEICGDRPIEFSDLEGGFYINVRVNKRKDLDVEALQNQFMAKGCYVFASSRTLFEHLPECLTVFPTTDKYEAIAAMGTNGCNYGIGTGYVLQWLQALEAKQPFIITYIRYDSLALRFLSPLEDVEYWADEMYEFCPDLIDQGVMERDRLIECLKTSDRISFWWD